VSYRGCQAITGGCRTASFAERSGSGGSLGRQNFRDLSNVVSQRVIEANGGQLVERFFQPAAYGGAEALRYRIYFE
jgi:hypothetical protein